MRSRLAEMSKDLPCSDLVCKRPCDNITGQSAAISAAYKQMPTGLHDQLMAYIQAQSYSFFEHLVIDAVLALGYAGRKRELAHT